MPWVDTFIRKMNRRFYPELTDDIAAMLRKRGYERAEVIGAGGFGTVYHALHERLGRPVAVKVVHSHLAAQSPACVARFLQECKILGELDHTNIVRVFDAGDLCDGSSDFVVPFLVMELVDGGDLRKHLVHGPIDLTRSLNIITQVCEAIQHAHDRHILHRDVKPENIFVRGDGQVKLGDFGIALCLAESRRYTKTGQNPLTFGYAAPEVLRGGPVNEQCDVFSVGAVLYEMLAGELPVGGYVPLSRLRPQDCDLRLDAVIERLLAADLSTRYATIRDLLQDIRPLRTGHEPSNEKIAISVSPSTSSSPAAPSIQSAAHGEGKLLLCNCGAWFLATPNDETAKCPSCGASAKSNTVSEGLIAQLRAKEAGVRGGYYEKSWKSWWDSMLAKSGFTLDRVLELDRKRRNS